MQRIPAAPLAGFVRVLWYAQIPDSSNRRERILPNGCVQVILSLARDFLLDCPEGKPDLPTPPALIVGARSSYEIVDGSDMADLIGVVFEPGRFGCFASDKVDLFSNRSVPLEDVWGAPAQDLRWQLRETATAAAKLELMENFLLTKFARRLTRNRTVEFALSQFKRAPGASKVREVAKNVGWSERRLSQVFREEVGLSPKVWCRIQRFQRAVRQLHAGADVGGQNWRWIAASTTSRILPMSFAHFRGWMRRRILRCGASGPTIFERGKGFSAHRFRFLQDARGG